MAICIPSLRNLLLKPLLSLIVIIFLCAQCFYSNFASSDFESVQKGLKSDVVPIINLNTIGLQGCIKECLSYTNCAAINFNHKSYRCDILNDEHGTLEENVDFWYSNISNWREVIDGLYVNHSCLKSRRFIKLSSGLAYCVISDCGTKPSVDNGKVVNCSLSVGSSCSLECSTNYAPVGDSTAICNSSGNWTTNFYCTDDCTQEGVGYTGQHNTTDTGKTCQRWDSLTPHSHSYGTFDTAIDNYCRDFEYGIPWCYTVDPLTRWENCSVPKCMP